VNGVSQGAAGRFPMVTLMRSKSKNLVGCVGVLASVCLLSGCVFADQATNGYATARRDGESIVLAVCADVHVGSLYFSENGPSIKEGEEPFWTSAPNLDLKRGDRLSSDPIEHPLVSGETRRSPRLLAGDRLFVALLDRKGGTTGIAAQFDVPPEGLSETRWLHEDGSESRGACEGISDPGKL